ncbi:disulfide bond formation protein B [Candidatus Liberibacter africanus]|uniref:disulfide bond formation protein B n=1 Tax=Liberibacter africanus TaxID=34020 RepID=UPI00339D69EF
MIKSLLSTSNNVPLIRIILISITGIIICFLTIQYIGGYPPCHFCMQEQRIYYCGFIIAITINLSCQNRRYHNINFYLMLMLSLLMILNIIISVIHIGIEWGIWKNSAICTDKSKIESITSTKDLLTQIGKDLIHSCNKSKLYILNLSLVWWNLILSFSLLYMTSIATYNLFKKTNEH